MPPPTLQSLISKHRISLPDHPTGPKEKPIFAQCCRPLWPHVRDACGLREGRELVSHLIWPCQPTTPPQPSNSHSQNQVAASQHIPVKKKKCQGKWEKTVEQRWERGTQCQLQEKTWGEAAAPLMIPQKSTVSCLILTLHASSLAPAVFFHCPTLLSPVPCFPLHMYSHSFLLLQPQENCLLGFLEGFFYIAQLF